MDFRAGHQRDRWRSSSGFVAMCCASCSGVATALRLPWVAAQHGGAFIWVYLVCLVLLGWPAVLLEMGLGQIRQKAAGGAFGRTNARARAVGVGAGFMALLASWCYAPLLAYLCVYLYKALFYPLPWTVFSTDHLATSSDTAVALSLPALPDYELAHAFFLDSVSEQTGGGFSFQVAMGLAAVWTTIFCASFDGVVVSGVAAQMTLGVSLVSLVAVLATCLHQFEGAGRGIEELFVPQSSDVFTGALLVDAASHALLSCNVGTAVLVAFGSYHAPSRDIVRYSYCIVGCQAAASLLCGAAAFAALGAMRHEAARTNPEITTIARMVDLADTNDGALPGYALTFASFSFVYTSLEPGAANVLACLLFYSSICLGMITLHSWSAAVLGIVKDVLVNAKTWQLSGAACVTLCAGALPFAAGSIGYNMLTTMDRFFVRTALPLAVMLQAAVGSHAGGRTQERDTTEVEVAVNARGRHKVPSAWRHLVWGSPFVLLPLVVGGYAVTFGEAHHSLSHTIAAIVAVALHPALILVLTLTSVSSSVHSDAAVSANIWADDHITGYTNPGGGALESGGPTQQAIHLPKG